MTDEISQAMQQARRYWYIDGLSEIGVGFLFALIGGYIWLQSIVPAASFWGAALSIGFVFVILGGAWAVRKSVAAIKARLTYPRTGYVAYARPRRKRRLLSAAVASLVSFSLIWIYLQSPNNLFFIPTLSAFLMSAICLYVAAAINLARYYVLAAFSALLGVAIAAFRLEVGPGSALFYGLLGAAYAGVGLFTLFRYLNTTQPLGAENDE